MKNIVTISREYGSGGYEVGRRVAERMNYKFYDKELIAHIADKFLIPESFVAATEETELKKKNIFHEVFPVFTRTENENADYIFREQGKFIVRPRTSPRTRPSKRSPTWTDADAPAMNTSPDAPGAACTTMTA